MGGREEEKGEKFRKRVLLSTAASFLHLIFSFDVMDWAEGNASSQRPKVSLSVG